MKIEKKELKKISAYFFWRIDNAVLHNIWSNFSRSSHSFFFFGGGVNIGDDGSVILSYVTFHSIFRELSRLLSCIDCLLFVCNFRKSFSSCVALDAKKKNTYPPVTILFLCYGLINFFLLLTWYLKLIREEGDDEMTTLSF